jgi:hypothetical protein
MDIYEGRLAGLNHLDTTLQRRSKITGVPNRTRRPNTHALCEASEVDARIVYFSTNPGSIERHASTSLQSHGLHQYLVEVRILRTSPTSARFPSLN